jgi:hypothetical protein
MVLHHGPKNQWFTARGYAQIAARAPNATEPLRLPSQHKRYFLAPFE